MIPFIRHIAKGYWLRIAGIVVLGVLEVAFSLAFVWFSKTIIDIATGDRQGSLVFYAVLLAILLLFQIASRVLEIRLVNMTSVRLGNATRNNVFSHLLFTRWQDLSTMHSGDMLTRVIRDTDDVVSLIVNAFPTAVSAFLQFVGALVILVVLDPILALILGLGMPFLAFFSKIYYKRMRKYTLEVKESESLITSLMEESLLNQIVIRTFERQDEEVNRLHNLQSQLHHRVHKRTNVSAFANALMHLAFGGGYVAAFLWSAFALAKKTITFGTVTAYLQLVSRIQRPLFDLMRLLPNIIAAKAAIERLTYLTGFEREDTGKKIFLQGDVTLSTQDLSFSYDNETPPVFSGFSLTAKPGTMVAVMGETGAGKTTLLRLLLGLVKPTAGTITISDENTSVPVSERTRSNFVYVPQGGSLFSGTIRENLLIGDPEADDERMRKALKTASASFVFDLPEGLDTLLGEKGSRLSEGQAQRIAIARSLLRPGKILLLDEATSALDNETEKTFLHNLKQEMGNRVVLFITHHADVAKFCDEIIRIN